MSANETTRCVAAPQRLLDRCREESGIQTTSSPLPLPSSPTRRVLLHTDSIAPDIDALGYDPFDDQPTLIEDRAALHASARKLRVALSPEPVAVLLTRRRNAWLDALPAGARLALAQAAAQRSADEPRIAGAIAHARH